jgi:hypothetical protein
MVMTYVEVFLSSMRPQYPCKKRPAEEHASLQHRSIHLPAISESSELELLVWIVKEARPLLEAHLFPPTAQHQQQV